MGQLVGGDPFLCKDDEDDVVGGVSMGQLVIPAKQLWLVSEHSSLNPLGLGSHTRLVFDAETPH